MKVSGSLIQKGWQRLKNKLCDLLGIEYPIIQGAMQWLSVPELASAVSNAGGLGIITAATLPTKEALIKSIQKMRTLTEKPFAVNISFLPTLTSAKQTMDFVDAVIESNVAIVETSGSNPEVYLEKLKFAGITVIHKSPSVRFAKKAQNLGADAITILSYEGGGHPGMGEVTSIVQIRKAVQELSVPLIAAGGIADAGGLAAALALGADGVMMATRFVASKECLIHPNFKEVILKYNENDTMIVQRSIKNAHRIWKNTVCDKIVAMESRGAKLEELMTVIAGTITKNCYKSGDIEGCPFPIGQCIGLIGEVKSAAEIVHETMEGARRIIRNLNEAIN